MSIEIRIPLDAVLQLKDPKVEVVFHPNHDDLDDSFGFDLPYVSMAFERTDTKTGEKPIPYVEIYHLDVHHIDGTKFLIQELDSQRSLYSVRLQKYMNEYKIPYSLHITH